MRRAARTDANHGEIRDAFRQCGCLVESLAPLGRGVPDLLVSKHGRVVLVEVKHGRGTLTPDQVEWHGKGWPVWIVREINDVPIVVKLGLMGADFS